jgi:acetyl-CoA carboxylase biotin carboxyl carrier protein
MSEDLALTPEDVAEIVAILDGSPYDRLDVSTGRFRLRLAREGEGWTQDWTLQDDPSVQIAAPVAGKEPAAAESEGEGTPVRAPLPGTFYRAPQPGAPPFVEVGDAVTPDTVVGIIETMKLMNPVHAGTSGTIAAIPVDNGTMVDAQAVLMRVVA